MTEPSQPDFRLVLRPRPGGPPPIIRLRRLLKAALRAFGLRCLRVEEIRPDDPASKPPSREATDAE